MISLTNLSRKVSIIFIFFMSAWIYAQDDDEFDFEQDDAISNVFNYGVLINAQTTEVVPKGSFELRINHRFGELDLTDFNNTVVDEFLGLDGSANIRFSFSFAVSDKLQLGIGRTKVDKVYDLEGKYKVLSQKETGMPVSAAVYFNVGYSSREFPEVGPNEFFPDLETPFEYKFAHRLSYNTQILLSRKFGEKFSLELNPTVIYRNLVPPGQDNFTVGGSLGGRFRTGLTSSIIFEYSSRFNNRIGNYHDPISLGFEIGTAGHAFQMFVTTTNQIIEQYIYSIEPSDYTEGQILIGFNIKRTFWNGNNN